MSIFSPGSLLPVRKPGLKGFPTRSKDGFSTSEYGARGRRRQNILIPPNLHSCATVHILGQLTGYWQPMYDKSMGRRPVPPTKNTLLLLVATRLVWNISLGNGKPAISINNCQIFYRKKAQDFHGLSCHCGKKPNRANWADQHSAHPFVFRLKKPINSGTRAAEGHLVPANLMQKCNPGRWEKAIATIRSRLCPRIKSTRYLPARVPRDCAKASLQDSA